MKFRRNPLAMQRFYDWFSRFYPGVEKNLRPSLARVIQVLDPEGQRYRQDSVIELACGSANFGLLLAPRFDRYEGRDQSGKMLERARLRWNSELTPEVHAKYPTPPFLQGNLLELSDSDLGAPDWIAMSFGLHLFAPEEELRLLSLLFRSAAKGLLVVDHEQRWSPGIALVEWLEGSWFDRYIHIDFEKAAHSLGAVYRCRIVEGCQVMEFLKT